MVNTCSKAACCNMWRWLVWLWRSYKRKQNIFWIAVALLLRFFWRCWWSDETKRDMSLHWKLLRIILWIHLNSTTSFKRFNKIYDVVICGLAKGLWLRKHWNFQQKFCENSKPTAYKQPAYRTFEVNKKPWLWPRKRGCWINKTGNNKRRVNWSGKKSCLLTTESVRGRIKEKVTCFLKAARWRCQKTYFWTRIVKA
jgi:hypothetical protein